MGYSATGNGIIFIILGAVALAYSVNEPVNCGFNGSPPLRDWLFGTGIAYLVIGCTATLCGVLVLCTGGLAIIPVIIVLACSSAFTFAWMIVGAVSLWRDGGDCIQNNFTLWQVGMAEVIISIIMVVCSASVAKSTSNENQ